MKTGVSDNVGGVKHFLSVLTRALRRARHFALVEGSAIPTKGPLVISFRSETQFDPCISSVRNSIMIITSNSPVKGSGIPSQFLGVLLHTIACSELSRVSERVNYYDALIEKIKTTPGVTDAAISGTGAPPNNNWFQPIQIAGGSLDRSLKSVLNLVGSEYFFVLRIPLLQGRTLTREEVLRGGHVAVISKTFAQRYFPDADPIGRLIIPSALSQV